MHLGNRYVSPTGTGVQEDLTKRGVVILTAASLEKFQDFKGLVYYIKRYWIIGWTTRKLEATTCVIDLWNATVLINCAHKALAASGQRLVASSHISTSDLMQKN